jgi:hypothetical protein
MIPEERILSRLTRHKLKRLPNWPIWDEAFDAQLDAHYRDGAIGDPVPRPKHNSTGTKHSTHTMVLLCKDRWTSQSPRLH